MKDELPVDGSSLYTLIFVKVYGVDHPPLIRSHQDLKV